MRQAIENLIKALVENPDAVEVTEKQDRAAIIFQARVAENDIGKVIGREGRTIKAVRSIIHAASLKQGRRFQFDIIE